MAEGLNFTLPPSTAHRPPRMTFVLLVAVLLVCVAQLVLSLQRAPSASQATVPGAAPEKVTELAAKLEDRGLYVAAAEVWRESLRAGEPSAEARARAWCQIGRLCQRAERYEEAVSAYYRSEAAAKVPDLEEALKTGIVQSLERLGQFAGLRREVEARTSLPGTKTPSADVAAELGQTQITNGDVERLIQEDLDRQSEAYLLGLAPEQRQRYRQQMQDRFKDPRAKEEWLEQYVVEELLYREALEKKLPENSAFKQLAANTTKKLLAQQLVMQEMAARATLTESDLANAYEASKSRYVEPERAEVSQILVKEESEATAALERLRKGEKFADLAAALSLDEGTKKDGGVIKEPLQKGSAIPGVGFSAAFSAAVFETAEGQLAAKPVKTEKGWHVIEVRKRLPERQKPLPEVREQVFQELSRAKQRECQQELIERLKTKYHAVIHRAPPKEAPEGAPDATKPPAAPPAPAPKDAPKTPKPPTVRG